jgi:hypothetical protein
VSPVPHLDAFGAAEHLATAHRNLSAASEELDAAASELPALESHAARVLRGDVADVLRKLANLRLFAERVAS